MKSGLILSLISLLFLGLMFQNCSEQVKFSSVPTKSSSPGDSEVENNGGPVTDGSLDPVGLANTSNGPGNNMGSEFPGAVLLGDGSSLPQVSVCEGVSCELSPLTTKPAVTTLLLALGDQANSELVVSGASSQLIAETIIRYSSPTENPRILIVRDFNTADEDPEDTIYVRDVLLARYDTTFIVAPQGGLTADLVKDYDLVWFNNPGHPMSSATTYQTLLSFPGAVVLQGDDLSRGNGFSLEALTGLRYIDNGAEVICEAGAFAHDNNGGRQYYVQMDQEILGTDSTALNFRYGNDIDLTEVTKPGAQILARARGGDDSCTDWRPAIVRYEK